LRLSRYDDDDEEDEARVKTNKEHQEALQDSNPENNMPPIGEELYATNKEPLPSVPNV